jgi:hypothetical protein
MIDGFDHWDDGMTGPTHPYLVKITPFPLSKSLINANIATKPKTKGMRIGTAFPPIAMIAVTKLP